MSTYTYNLSATGRCPVDETCNTYQIEITSETPIMAEEIAKAVSDAFAEPITQEDATRRIRCRIHGAVRSRGVHLIGVGGFMTRVEIEVFEK